MAPVTIVQVVPHLGTSGGGSATLEIAKALTRARAKASLSAKAAAWPRAIAQGGGEAVEMQVASKNPLDDLANAQRLTRLIRDRGMDLVRARSRAPAWSALIAARRTGILSHDVSRRLWRVRPIKAFYDSVIGRGDIVIANSRSLPI